MTTTADDPSNDRAEAPAANERLDHPIIGLLGVVTIVAYGSWYYAFGVLLDAIRLDTGWSEATLAGSFSLAMAAGGLGAVAGGRTLDRMGPVVVLALGGSGGCLGMIGASMATEPALFIATSVVAMTFLGGFGFYHVTMTSVVTVNPGRPAQAISVLTVWGALASFIYLPATAALLERFDWRATIRILAAVVAVTFAVGAVAMGARRKPDTTEADTSHQPVPPMSEVIRGLFANRRRSLFTLAVALGGMAMSTVLVYQVPAMTAAGLSLGTAATLSGIRGFCQLLGRLPLSAMVDRMGSTGSLLAAFAAIAVGGGLLAFSSTVVVGVAFAVTVGFGMGAFSPLNGIKSEELYDRATLGATMGLYSSALLAVGAIGPAVAGLLVDATDDRRLAGGVIAVGAAGAAMAVIALGRLERDGGRSPIGRLEP